MELREFVRETLTEILAGVREAQAALEPHLGRHGVINPTWNDVADLPDHVQTVNFDVAVTASDQSSKAGKGGIKVWAAELGGELKGQTENKTVSRISFCIPVVPPTTTVQGVNKPRKPPSTQAAGPTDPALGSSSGDLWKEGEHGS